MKLQFGDRRTGRPGAIVGTLHHGLIKLKVDLPNGGQRARAIRFRRRT